MNDTKHNPNSTASSHTPGPWRLEHQGSNLVFMGGTGQNGQLVGRGHGRTFGEAAANARLISEAPKLLELLTEIVNVARIEPRDLTVEEEHWLDEAQAVLAKIQGQRHESRFDALRRHLDASHIRLEEFGCFVALCPDRQTIFWCPMNADGSPECEMGDPHLNWGEVTAPEPEFVGEINELYGTCFDHSKFAGR
jgi:hypothetical protein